MNEKMFTYFKIETMFAFRVDVKNLTTKLNI